MKLKVKLAAVLLAGAAILPIAGIAATGTQVKYRHVTVNNIDIFYREAGDPALPTLLLLHGFPSSSAMFRDLIPLLSDRFHLVAPDYPGMGASEAPPADKFKATFDSVADVITEFAAQLKLPRYILYMQDYGGPVGMRMAVKNPERVSGLIIQNTPVSLDGWDPKRLAIVQSNAGPETPEKRAVLAARVTMDTAKFLHLTGTTHPEQINPDSWAIDAYGLSDPEKRRIMTDLQVDIPSNLPLYAVWADYFKTKQPRSLVVWGRNDPVFAPNGGDIVKKLIPAAEVHYYDTGHYALDDKAAEIAEAIRGYFSQ